MKGSKESQLNSNFCEDGRLSQASTEQKLVVNSKQLLRAEFFLFDFFFRVSWAQINIFF
jgi:hypothetical protein